MRHKRFPNTPDIGRKAGRIATLPLFAAALTLISMFYYLKLAGPIASERASERTLSQNGSIAR